ncbi:unnamed protein product, partial [Symbiodinium sp. KB8]
VPEDEEKLACDAIDYAGTPLIVPRFIRQTAGRHGACPRTLRPISARMYCALSRLMPATYRPFLDNLARLGVWGDGKCLLHAIMAALNWAGYNLLTNQEQLDRGARLACKLSSIVRPEVAEPGTPLYHAARQLPPTYFQELLCTPGKWTDDTTIRLLARAMGVNIVFWDACSDEFVCDLHGPEPHKQPLHVVIWIKRRHFEPLVMTDGDTLLQDGPGLFMPGHPIHTAVILQYAAQCGNRMLPPLKLSKEWAPVLARLRLPATEAPPHTIEDRLCHGRECNVRDEGAASDSGSDGNSLVQQAAQADTGAPLHNDDSTLPPLRRMPFHG